MQNRRAFLCLSWSFQPRFALVSRHLVAGLYLFYLSFFTYRSAAVTESVNVTYFSTYQQVLTLSGLIVRQSLFSAAHYKSSG